MRKRLYTAVLAAATCAAGAAGAACNLESAGLPERHAALADERGALTAEARAALRELHDSAAVLDRLGFEVGCDEVVEIALALIEDEAAWRAPGAGDVKGTIGDRNLETLAARGTAVEASRLLGQPLLSTDGRPLGTVADVLLDQARDASHAIVERGGIWGRGGRIAVPAARLLTDPGDGALYAEIAPGALAEAPVYGPGWDAGQNDTWYEDQSGRAVDATAARVAGARAAERSVAEQGMAADPAVAADGDAGTPGLGKPPSISGGPKRIRVEKDRPAAAEGSND